MKCHKDLPSPPYFYPLPEFSGSGHHIEGRVFPAMALEENDIGQCRGLPPKEFAAGRVQVGGRGQGAAISHALLAAAAEDEGC
ncbi:hypothetical protein E2562_039193 [Oryza meyeriana var. granulata]|uniref:Uncharacterized protein n=1 Tax=Oryza meyeriana var. granulata TaxID=110450 RepID=A0A6G1C210_9ORYZ|nr:hypothetical protein E2562_039193 [Oryza meyeriana var. granulata]